MRKYIILALLGLVAVHADDAKKFDKLETGKEKLLKKVQEIAKLEVKDEKYEKLVEAEEKAQKDLDEVVNSDEYKAAVEAAEQAIADAKTAWEDEKKKPELQEIACKAERDAVEAVPVEPTDKGKKDGTAEEKKLAEAYETWVTDEKPKLAPALAALDKCNKDWIENKNDKKEIDVSGKESAYNDLNDKGLTKVNEDSGQTAKNTALVDAKKAAIGYLTTQGTALAALKAELLVLNPGLKEGSQAAVDAQLKAGKRVYLLSEIDDSNLKANGQFVDFNTKLEAESLKWKGAKEADASVTKDDEASGDGESDAEKKKPWEARVKADGVAKKAIDDLSKFIKENVLDKVDTDEKKKDFKLEKDGYTAALAQYEKDIVAATVSILESLVLTTTDADDKKAYQDYLDVMKVEKETADKAAKAAEEGGSLMWLWCILIGLVAIVGIFFLYRYCKNKDDKQD